MKTDSIHSIHAPRCGTLALCAAAFFMLAAGCAPVRMVISQDPRACTEATARPPARPGYHTGWATEGWQQPAMAGYDVLFQISPQEALADHFIVQRLTMNTQTRDWNPATHQCDIAASGNLTVEEVLRPAGFDVQRYFHPGSQSMIEVNVNGMAGYVEAPAGHPFPGIAADQNAAFLNMGNGPNGGGPIYIDGLTPAEQQDLLQHINDASMVQYQYRYQYDGCNRPSQTACGTPHCLQITRSDIRNGQQVRSATQMFSGNGSPVCPVMGH